MKVYYFSFIYFPSVKAHSLYVAKQADAFTKEGLSVELVLPKRTNPIKEVYADYYQISESFLVSRIFSVDLFGINFFKPIAHRVGVFTFCISAILFRLIKVDSEDIIITNDIFTAWAVSFIHPKVIIELHDYPEKRSWIYRNTFRRVFQIQTNNWQKIDLVCNDYRIPKTKVYAAHNGVEIDDFAVNVSKTEAIKQIGLDGSEKIVVYTGHLYDWKGVDTLAQSAEFLQNIKVIFVGGTKQDVERMKRKYSHLKNVLFTGHQPHAKIPIFQKAADVLVLPNTAKKDISRLHTSPMKVFEYMASGVPIVASDIPSIREVLDDSSAVFVEPDNPQQLAVVIKEVLNMDDLEKKKLTNNAFQSVLKYTWEKRAQKIMKHITS